jgi:acyl-CoA thioesterase-1
VLRGLTVRTAIFCLGIFLTAGCQQPAAVSPSPSASAVAKYDGTLVAFGDSLSEGLGVEPEQAYPAQLQRRLEKDGFHWKVVNAGVSGETSSGARERLDWVIGQLKPDVMILESGANDGLRGIDPSITEKNLEAMLVTLKAKKIKVMLAGMRVLKNSGKDYEEKFAAIYPRLAKAQQVELIPFFLENVAGKIELNQKDQIHPTEKGYAIIIEHLAPQVEAVLKKP